MKYNLKGRCPSHESNKHQNKKKQKKQAKNKSKNPKTNQNTIIKWGWVYSRLPGWNVTTGGGCRWAWAAAAGDVDDELVAKLGATAISPWAATTRVKSLDGDNEGEVLGRRRRGWSLGDGREGDLAPKSASGAPYDGVPGGRPWNPQPSLSPATSACRRCSLASYGRGGPFCTNPSPRSGLPAGYVVRPLVVLTRLF